MLPSTETGIKFPRIRTRVQQVVVRHVWALPRFFFEMVAQKGPPGTANSRIRARKVGHDLLTSYVCNYTGDSGKPVPF